MAALSIVHSILQHYVLPEILNIDYLGGNGGFSGAQLWKIGTAESSYCVRRWPLSHPNRERLEWINLVLVHTAGMGCEFIPAPLETKSGQRFVSAGGFFWEVTKWMEGVACFKDDPNETRLARVAESLAKFHLASAQVNLGFEKSKNLRTRYEAMANSTSLIAAIRQITRRPSRNARPRDGRRCMTEGDSGFRRSAPTCAPALRRRPWRREGRRSHPRDPRPCRTAGASGSSGRGRRAPTRPPRC